MWDLESETGYGQILTGPGMRVTHDITYAHQVPSLAKFKALADEIKRARFRA